MKLSDFTVKIKYRAAGQNYESDLLDTDHYSIVQKSEGERFRVVLSPKCEMELISFVMRQAYLYPKDCDFYVNGYQSWTDTREFSCKEKIKKITPYKKLVLGNPNLDIYGDRFKKVSGKRGVFHGYSYSYVRDGESFTLWGSLSEKEGYTVFNFLYKQNQLVIEKDVEGTIVSLDYDLVDIVEVKGTYQQVFDGYFSFLNLPAPRMQKATGYTSWYNYYRDIDESIILRDLNAISECGEKLDIFQIDDGFQSAIGDWMLLDEKKFPNGLKKITDEIHAHNMLAGLWLAPVVAEVKSKLVKEHPEWFLKEKNGSYIKGNNWNGFYVLNIYADGVQDYLKKVFDTVLNEWGFDMVKLDFLSCACLLPLNGKSRAQVMCETMDFLRACVGDKLILGCGVPLFPAFGKVDFCRIGADLGLHWKRSNYSRLTSREDVSTENAVNNTIFRRHLDQRAFVNDPDVFLLRDKNISLSFDQRALIAKINKVFGNILFTSDNVADYNEKQKAVFSDTVNKGNVKIYDAYYVEKNLLKIVFDDAGKKNSITFDVRNGKMKTGNLEI